MKRRELGEKGTARLGVINRKIEGNMEGRARCSVDDARRTQGEDQYSAGNDE